MAPAPNSLGHATPQHPNAHSHRSRERTGMDVIHICDLEVFYRVGVPDEERARPQRLLLDIQIHHDFTAAAQFDDLTKTIDYFAVTQRLLKYGDRAEWKLIEKLAH